MRDIILILLSILIAIFIIIFRPEIKTEEKKSCKERKYKGENIACKILEEIYNVPFTKEKPDFLINPKTKRKLELDCYNDSLKIALEYQGEQHYKWPNYTNQSYKEFQDQVYRDEIKRKICKELGIKLVEVPYYIRYDKMKDYILEKLME